MKKILLAVPFVMMLAACDQTPNSRQIEAAKQEEMTMRAVQSVGMPSVNNFAEKRMMKDIIEKRDAMQPTYTYIVDMGGKFHKVCDSLGYGLPYATQYTNPQMRVSSDRGVVTLPQADPNGLYSPASADGTWVMCINPKTKKAEPQYIEPRIVTMTYPLE
jgi:hypothetical protein